MKNNYWENYKEGKKISEELTKQLKRTESLNLEGCPHVKKWLSENKFSKNVIENLSNVSYLENSKIDPNTHASNAIKLMSEITGRERRRSLMIRFSSVAVTAAVLAVSFLVWNNTATERVSVPKYVISEAKLAYDKPTLILNNGNIINLTEISDLSQIPDRDSSKTIAPTEETINTLIVPKMCTYTITLPDSTEVTLNANSELKYPTTFDETKREVFLKGEAYFKVRKNNIPFVVSGASGAVKVYGTEFNVNLRTHNEIEAVLVRGVIGVSANMISDSEVIIKPNQQIIFNTQNGIKSVRDVIVDEYVAWMDGFFKCDRQHLTLLLKEISNWYNIEFEYKNKTINDIVISSSLPVNTPLNELLKLIEINTNVKFIKKNMEVYEIEKL